MRQIWALVAAGGVGLVAGGTGLALYSRYFASTVSLDEVWVACADNTKSSCAVNAERAPGNLALTAAVIGALLLVAVVLAVVRTIRGWEGFEGTTLYVWLATLGALVVLPGMAFHYRLPEAYEKIRFEYPFFEQLPTAVAAGGLVVLGALLMGRAVVTPRRLRLPAWPALTLATAAGVLISGTVAVAAVVAGDDDRIIDHVTADRVEAAAVPNRLGAERDRLQLPARGNVVVAGAGFVTADLRGLTAYDGATGKPRWHYLRTPVERDGEAGVTYSSNSLHDLDGGRVVVARWTRGDWTAFDAFTGEMLWRGADLTRDHLTEQKARSDESTLHSGAGQLTVSRADRVMGYDPYTGTRRWSADTSIPGCSGSERSLSVTDRAVYRVDECQRGDDSWLVATVLDGRTGDVVGVRELARFASDSPRGFDVELDRFANTVQLEWRSRSGSGRMVLGAPEQIATAAITGVSDEYMIAADPAGPDVIVRDPAAPADPRRYIVISSDAGAVKYAPAGMSGSPNAVLFLPAAIVEQTVSDDSPGTFQILSWSRSDGVPLRTTSLDTSQRCDDTQLLAAPGTILSLCYGVQGIELVTFAGSA